MLFFYGFGELFNEIKNLVGFIKTVIYQVMLLGEGPGWFTPSETRREYFPVDSSKTSLFCKVPEGVIHPELGNSVRTRRVKSITFRPQS